MDWDGQYSSGRKRRSDRDGMVVDMDSFSRKYRKPRIETQEEINQRMLSVELAIKEALYARGESRFTDQEFPPNDLSLFVDPESPPTKLQVFLFIIFKFYLLYCLPHLVLFPIQVVSEWLRPGEIARQNHPDYRPCLFSGPPNPSDVCQVFMFYNLLARIWQ